MPGYIVNVTVARLRDGWEAWMRKPALATREVESREEAVATLAGMFLDWCERQGANPTDFAWRWFDTASHFKHCDLAVVYPTRPEDEGWRGETVTFLGYAPEGQAKVCMGGFQGYREFFVRHDSLKPLSVDRVW